MRFRSKHALAGFVLSAGLVMASASAGADEPQKTSDSAASAKKKQEEAKAKKKADEGKVKQANDAADEAAKKANADIVGKETQQKNETQAETPRPKPDDNKEARDAAKAIGKATTNAAEWVAVGVEDTSRATDKPGKYNPFAIEWSPLGIISGGRLSLNLEWAPVTHNVIVVSPHIVRTSVDIATDSDTTAQHTFTGFGGELGYRYYTGRRGMNGVFIGPSFIAGVYNGSLPAGDQAFTDVGIALDVGVHEIVWNHLVIGGGVGVEYLHVSHDFHDLPSAPAQIASSGVKPRLLMEIGYGF